MKRVDLMETRFEVQFKEIVEAFCLGFEDIHLVNDGGYERGYAEGHDVGFAEGEVVGFQNGEVAGFSDAISKQTELTVRKNGEYLPNDNATGFSKVNVDLPPFSVEEKQIIFIDYDGTVLYSYTPEEVLALTELPHHESTDELLTFDGWNWTLEELKEEINLIGLDFMQHHKMAVGATYQTLNNNTYLFVKLDTPRGLSVYFSPNASSDIISIDWGDGSEPSEKTGTTSGTYLSHAYEKEGEYRICISGHVFTFGQNSVGIFGAGSSASAAVRRNYVLEKIYIGKANRVQAHAFSHCMNLKSIVISNGFQFLSNENAFYYCTSLHALVCPKSLYYTIGSRCFTLSSVETISFARSGLVLKSYAMSEARALRFCHIPSTTSLNSSNGQYALYGISSIESLTFFNECQSNAFANCMNLKYAMLKNITNIPNSLFSNCYSLRKFKAYGNISAVGASAFSDCASLGEIDFTACTSVPTLSSTNAFSGVPSTCKILVPASLYDEWIAATNWSAQASKIVAVEV
jgi:hypothetical protein